MDTVPDCVPLLMHHRRHLTDLVDATAIIHRRRIDRIEKVEVLRRVNRLAILLKMRTGSLQVVQVPNDSTANGTLLKMSLENVAP